MKGRIYIKKRKLIFILSLIIILFLTISFFRGETYVGSVYFDGIREKGNGDVVINIHNSEISRTIILKGEQELIWREFNNDDRIQVFELEDLINEQETYYIHLNTYFFPWNYFLNNDIEYIFAN